MNLGQIMQHDHQLPLTIDLLFPTQGEPFYRDGIIDMAEDQFDNPQEHAVNVAPEDGVDLLIFQIVQDFLIAKTAAGQNFPILQGTLLVIFEGIFNLFDDRFLQTMFLPLAEGFGADNHLMFAYPTICFISPKEKFSVSEDLIGPHGTFFILISSLGF